MSIDYDLVSEGGGVRFTLKLHIIPTQNNYRLDNPADVRLFWLKTYHTRLTAQNVVMTQQVWAGGVMLVTKVLADKKLEWRLLMLHRISRWKITPFMLNMPGTLQAWGSRNVQFSVSGRI